MSLISGNVTFNSGSINYSANSNVIVGASAFCGNAQNCGLISSGYFFDTAANVGTISSNAVFAGTAVNSGSVSVAVFSGNSINRSSVTTCAIFVDTAVNAGSTTYASFSGSAVNNGIVSESGLFFESSSNCGSVCGNAIFADTSRNVVGATVCGNAGFATGACNAGTVVGQTGIYFPGNWYDDSSSQQKTVSLNGSVTHFDQGDGVKAASFSNGAYIELHDDNSQLFNFGYGDFTIEFFLKPTSLSGDHVILDARTSSTTDNSFLIYQTGSILKIVLINSGGEDFGPSTDISTNWNHIAITRASNYTRLFINGALVGELNDGRNVYNINSIIRLGQAVNVNQPFDGKITALRVARSAIYTNAFNVPTSLLTATSETQLLLNFQSIAVPSVTWISWSGYGDNGGTATANPIATHHSLYTLNSTLTIGTQMFKDNSNDDSPIPNSIVVKVNSVGGVLINGMYYIWNANGIITDIIDVDPYN